MVHCYFIRWGGAFLGPRFTDKGLGFFCVEYPGYGLANGSVSEEAVLVASEALLQHLEVVKGVSRDSIILCGQSIGCAPAIELANRGYGSKLILISPFMSLKVSL